MKVHILAVLTLVVLVACGGGSEPSPEPQAPFPPPPAPAFASPVRVTFSVDVTGGGAVCYYSPGPPAGPNKPYGTGLDVPSQTPVFASRGGTVRRASFHSCLGNLVIIEHDGLAGRGNLYTLYAHLDSFDVALGARVEQGDRIGASGNTGSCTTGPHLHFELVDSASPLTWGSASNSSTGNLPNYTDWQDPARNVDGWAPWIGPGPGGPTETLLLNDPFDGSGLASLNPFWTPFGQDVVLGDPVGWVSIRQNVTDTYARLESQALPAASAVRVRMLHLLTSGSDTFLPAVHFRLSSGQTVSLLWMRSRWSLDYCNEPGRYTSFFDAVIFRIWNGTRNECTTSAIAATSVYGRVVTSEMTVDVKSGVATYDLDGDGTEDIRATFAAPQDAKVERIVLDGYGWFTGHRLDIDNVQVWYRPAN